MSYGLIDRLMDMSVLSQTRTPLEAVNYIHKLEEKLEIASLELSKLEYWFDTDQEIITQMSEDEAREHTKILKSIRTTLTELKRTTQ